MSRFVFRVISVLALVLLPGISACGDVKVNQKDGAAEADAKVTPDVPGNPGTDATTPGPDTGGIDVGDKPDGVPIDGVAPDAPAGTECETPFDCNDKVKVKTACIQAACENGFCVKKTKPVGAKCIDPSLAVGECNASSCDAEGKCVLGNLANGVACGATLCGKKCAAGECVVATDADYDDSNPCTKDSCNQGIEIVHEPITDLTAPCDDTDKCTEGDVCVLGKCQGAAADCGDGILCTVDTCNAKDGCVHTADGAKCDDGDPCSKDGCDLAAGCTTTGVNAKLPCDDGNVCTVKDACSDAGSCIGKSECACQVDADCKTTNLCLGTLKCVDTLCVADPTTAVQCSDSLDTFCQKNACDPKSGECKASPIHEDEKCDDGNLCTSKAFCLIGTCQGSPDLDCDDKNVCTIDSCSPLKGCVHEAGSAECDDANPCTSSSACDKGGCVGTPKPCDDGVACTLDSCDKKTGACSNTGDAKPCDDKNPCTKDLCDVKLGCVKTADAAGTCDDGDVCTTDSCQAGKCVSVNTCPCKVESQAKDCNDNNPCTADTCDLGNKKCKNDAAAMDSKSCDTGDKCQVAGSGSCGAGVCKTGNKPLDCSTKADACNNAACNPATGLCQAVPKIDGTTCDFDKSGCTGGDACEAGKCTVGAPVSCASTAGACNDAACVSTAATTFTCKKVPKAKATPCEDGKFCTQADTCDGAGTCVGATAKTCAEASDACSTGQCDEVKDLCAKVPKAATIGCDDAQFCTVSDQCDGAGKCVGSPQPCVAGTCLLPKCDEAIDKCTTTPMVAGSTCTDNNACTAADKCDAASKCVGSAPVACTGDACNDSACNPLSGKCEPKPKANTTACDDAQKCTVGDKCDGVGKCVGGPWDATCGCQNDTMCNDGNACTTDKCDVATKKCSFAITAGAKCDDKDPCSTTDACNASGACAPTTLFDCTAKKNQCNGAACYSNAGAADCKLIPVTAGTACNDNLMCTGSDKCDSAGKCVGGAPPLCLAPPACFSVSCVEGKGCTNAPQAKGTTCSDGNPCSSGDVCDGIGKCLNGSAVPDFTSCDDGNKGTSGDHCLADTCAGFVQSFGPAGPVSGAVYQAKQKYLTTVASESNISNTTSSGSWRVWQLKPNGSGGYDSVAMPGSSGTALRDIASQVAVGYGNVIWFMAAAGTAWETTSNLAKSVAATGVPATNWQTVATRAFGSTLHVVLSGEVQLDNKNVTVRCTGPDTGAAAFSCTLFNSTPSYRALASSISFAYQPCTFICLPPVPVFDTFAAFRSVPGSSLLVNLVGFTALGTTGATSNFPFALNPTTTLPIGASHRYDKGTTAPATGTSTSWSVGPSGHVYVQIAGVGGYIKATVTPLSQSTYQFSGMSVFKGYVLAWGFKQDPNTGARTAVLMSHKEEPNKQTGAQNWTEHVLAQPTPGLLCPANQFATEDADSSAGSLLLLGNYCSGVNLAPKLLSMRAVLYSRHVPFGMPPPIKGQEAAR